MGRPVKDLNPFWQAVLCAVLAILVMRFWSEEGEQKPLDIVTIKRTSANRSTTSTPGPTRWEIAKRK
jgi:hypothetical protein